MVALTLQQVFVLERLQHVLDVHLTLFALAFNQIQAAPGMLHSCLSILRENKTYANFKI
jgi:hypothetical protein